MRSRSPFVTLLGLAGCAAAGHDARQTAPLRVIAPSSAPQPTSGPVTSHVDSAGSAGSASPSVNALPKGASTTTVSAALMSELGPAGREKLELVQSVCAATVFHDAGALKVGCRACPPFDASTGPDGRVVVDAPATDGARYELEAVYRGSFSRAGASEAALVFQGCESHAENWGGTLLVERRDEHWAVLDYRAGFHPTDCVPFRAADAHDILVCRWGSGHQGVSYEFLDSYDFVPNDPQNPELGWKRIVGLEDNTASECWGGRGERVHAGSIERFRLDVRPGAPSRLLADVKVADEQRSAAYRKKCEDSLKGVDLANEMHGTLRFESRTLGFVWRGAEFTPDASTERFMKRHRLTNE